MHQLPVDNTEAPQALAPEIDAKVRSSFARQGMMSFLGVHIAELGVGRCVLRLAHRSELTQQHGYFHGAAVGAIADVAGGYAAATVAALNDEVLTVEYKLSLHSAADGVELEAVGQVLRAGRLTTCLIDVINVRADGSWKGCATALQTITRVRTGTDSSPATSIDENKAAPGVTLRPLSERQ